MSSFFVPPIVKQLQMTGRLWRHGLAIMPHMMAGVGGPAEERRVWHADAAPAPVSAATERRSSSDMEEIDDGPGPDGAVLDAADEVLPDPVVPDLVSSVKYRRLYGNLPLHRAVVDVYCRMATLGGKLMGDNIADTTRMTEREMRALADEAREFVVDRVDLLFGPAHTSKAHLLANHQLAALLANGNLWEGDTSENEALHGPCKRMYSRTNKRGPTIVLQMMRAAETQKEVLRELSGTEQSDDKDGDGLFGLLEEVVDEGDVPTVPIETLARSHRGRRITIADLEQIPGMATLGVVLNKGVSCTVVTSPSFVFHCTFEWGAASVLQTVCASPSYLGQPRHDYLWYTDDSGRRQLGWAQLVVRMLDGVVDDFVVVRRLRPVPSIPDCSLSRSGCKRMVWDFAGSTCQWPVLVRVPLTDVLRIEHVVVDFLDLGDRHGLHAMPSNVPDTATERRAQRFFTNHFFPFTSRVLNPSS